MREMSIGPVTALLDQRPVGALEDLWAKDQTKSRSRSRSRSGKGHTSREESQSKSPSNSQPPPSEGGEPTATDGDPTVIEDEAPEKTSKELLREKRRAALGKWASKSGKAVPDSPERSPVFKLGAEVGGDGEREEEGDGIETPREVRFERDEENRSKSMSEKRRESKSLEMDDGTEDEKKDNIEKLKAIREHDEEAMASLDRCVGDGSLSPREFEPVEMHPEVGLTFGEYGDDDGGFEEFKMMSQEFRIPGAGSFPRPVAEIDAMRARMSSSRQPREEPQEEPREGKRSDDKNASSFPLYTPLFDPEDLEREDPSKTIFPSKTTLVTPLPNHNNVPSVPIPAGGFSGYPGAQGSARSGRSGYSTPMSQRSNFTTDYSDQDQDQDWSQWEDGQAKTQAKLMRRQRGQDIAAWQNRMKNAPTKGAANSAGAVVSMGEKGSFHKAECSFRSAGIKSMPLRNAPRSSGRKSITPRMNKQALRMQSISEAKGLHEDYPGH